MKRICAAVWIFMGWLALAWAAQSTLNDPAQIQREAYINLAQGDRSLDNDRLEEALAYYQAARDGYVQIETDFPTWEPRVIYYRKAYCDTQIDDIERRLSGEMEEESAQLNSMDTYSPAPVATPAVDFYAPQSYGRGVVHEIREDLAQPPTSMDAPEMETASLAAELSKLLTEVAELRPLQAQLEKEKSRSDKLSVELELATLQLDRLKTGLAAPEGENGEAFSSAADYAAMENQFQQLQQELEAAKKEGKRKKALADKEAKAEIKQLKGEKKALEAEVQTLQARLQEMEASVHARADEESTLNALEKEVQNLRPLVRQLNEQQAQNDQLAEQLAAATQQLQDLERQSSRMEEAEKAGWDAERKILEKQNKKLQADKKKTDKTLATQKQQLVELDDLRREIKVLRPLQTELDAQRMLNNQREKELEDAHRQLAEMQTQLAGQQVMDARLADLQQEADRLQTEKAEWETQREALLQKKAEAELLQTQAGEQRVLIDQLSQELEEANRRLADLQEQTTEQQQELDAAAELREKHAALVEESHHLQSALAEMELQRKELEAEQSDLLEKLAAKSDAEQQVRLELAERTRQLVGLSVLEREVDTLRQANVHLARELEAANQPLAQLEQRGDTLQPSLQTKDLSAVPVPSASSSGEEELAVSDEADASALPIILPEGVENAPAPAKAGASSFAAITAARQRLQMGDNHGALEAATEALQTFPGDLMLLNLQATALMKLQRYPEAANLFVSLARHHPKNADIQASLGAALMGVHMYEEARETLERAVRLDKNVGGEAYYNLATLYALIDPIDLKAARTYYQQALRLGIPPSAALEHVLQK
ncbi:MAG: hypothetical protein LBN38_01050 [Verrucomicrobiota bacterium]|jgi:hypothetical protein|nr:hypothetical protein [Verrucomicrobiota bacterium]